MAEPLISTAGRRSSRAIRRTTLRVMRSRELRMRRRFRRVHSPFAIGSPARLTMASIAVSLAIWSRLVTSAEWRAQRAALAGSRASTITSWPGCGQRLDQTAPDEAGRAGDQHALPRRQRRDQLGRGGRNERVRAPRREARRAARTRRRRSARERHQHAADIRTRPARSAPARPPSRPAPARAARGSRRS